MPASVDINQYEEDKSEDLSDTPGPISETPIEASEKPSLSAGVSVKNSDKPQT